MCSILGYYKLDQAKVPKSKFLDIGFNSMHSRGPDNENEVYLDDICMLGHQRLSIIDIDDEANQPMQSMSNSLVYNGELYNYLELKVDFDTNFSTSSDTEVFLKGLNTYGMQFLNKTNGMYALGYYNSINKKLYLIRDRFGVKPLHYTVEDGILYFSSEIEPLIQIKQNIKKNISVYKNYFTHTATDYNQETFIEDIYQVKAGHYLEVSDVLNEVQWYKGDDFSFDESILESHEKTLNFTENLLVNAIDIRMRADVPICLTLSGGIDSTTIYTLIKERLEKNIHPFTFIHPGADTNEYDKVLKLVKSYDDDVCVVSENESESFSDVEKDLDILEFPIWGISSRAYVNTYEKIKNDGFKVVLEGHGSDELLGGYPYMMESAIYEYLQSGKFLKAFETLKIANETGHDGLGTKNNIIFQMIKISLKILLKKISIKTLQENINWTFKFKILPITLRAFDRLSMNSSIESRAPFLDYRVVEFFKKLPLNYKVNKIGNKAILREILKKYNKDFIYLDKQKMGFASDIPKFFNNTKNKEAVKEYIDKFDMHGFESQKIKAMQIMNKEKIQWKDTMDLSKVILVSMINDKYNFDDAKQEVR